MAPQDTTRPDPTPQSPLICPMLGVYKVLFLFMGGIGLAAIGHGVIELADLPIDFLRREPIPASDAWVAIVVGILLQPFAWTGLARARMRIDGRTLEYLRFGPICTTGSLRLDDIARYGTGSEKHGYQSADILVLELKDGSKHSIKVSMFQDWSKLVEAIGCATGKPPIQGKQGWTGVRLKDEDSGPGA